MESWPICSEIPVENVPFKVAKKSLRFGMMMEAFALPDENSLFEFRTELTIWRSCARHSTLSSSCWVTFVEKIFGSSKILLGMYSRVSNKRGKVYPIEWTDNSTYFLLRESGIRIWWLLFTSKLPSSNLPTKRNKISWPSLSKTLSIIIY